MPAYKDRYRRSPQRAMRCDVDIIFLAVFHEALLGEVRVNFHLVHNRMDFCRLEEPLELWARKIGNTCRLRSFLSMQIIIIKSLSLTDEFSLSFLYELLHCCPCNVICS